MNNLLLGAIVGDVCGSYYEWDRVKNPDDVDLFLPQTSFTDDTIGTIATADALMNNKPFDKTYQEWFRRYDAKGCGKLFKKWVYEDHPKPYGSWGNGSAMRISPIGYAYHKDAYLKMLLKTLESAGCTHNSIEGIKGAIAISSIIYYSCRRLFLNEDFKMEAKHVLKELYPEYINKTLDELRPSYHFDSSCQGSVPHSILCFLESTSYEDCIIKAISMGGDADTMAAIAGSIAYSYYGQMDELLMKFVLSKLPNEMIEVVNKFDKFVEGL